MAASQMGSWKPSRYGRTCPVKVVRGETDTATSPQGATEWLRKDVKRDMEWCRLCRECAGNLQRTCLSLGKGTAWPILSGH